jgi:hypothetical protein
VNDPSTLPLSLRLVGEVLPKEFVVDIADLFWEFAELRPEIVHTCLDDIDAAAGLAAALAGVPRIILSNWNRGAQDITAPLYTGLAYKVLKTLPHVTVVAERLLDE